VGNEKGKTINRSTLWSQENQTHIPLGEWLQ